MLLVNKAKCNLCGDIIQSRSRHDFRTCKCSNLSIDGGVDYCRIVFQKNDFHDLSVEDDGKHETRREYLEWGTRGPNGRSELRYVKIKDISDNHLLAIKSNFKGTPESIGITLQTIFDEIEFRGISSII